MLSDGINTALAAAVVRYEKYNLFKEYSKYDGQADLSLYQAHKDSSGAIDKITLLVPETPVLIGSPLMKNSKIVVFGDCFDNEQLQQLIRAYENADDTSYIEGRFFYPVKFRAETVNGHDTSFVTDINNHKLTSGKYIKTGLHDYQILLPDGNIIGYYGKEASMDKSFHEQAYSGLAKDMIGTGSSNNSISTTFSIEHSLMKDIFQMSDTLLNDAYCISLVVEVNPWAYALGQMKTFYVLSLIIMLVLTALLLNGLSSVIERKFDGERRRRLMVDAIAHEMKNPIGIIRNSGEYLLEENVAEKRQQYSQTIITESERMNKAVVDMIDLSKMEAGTYPLELNEFHLSEVIEDNIARIKPLLKQRELELTVNNSTQQSVYADKKLISSTVSNFLSNAIKHADRGSTITVSLEYGKNKFSIHVHNQGATIDADKQHTVWETGYSGDNKSGSELGLAIVRNICILHGGSYGCVNENDGVTFWAEFSDQNDKLHKAELSTGPVINVIGDQQPLRGLLAASAGLIIQGFYGSLIIIFALFGLLPDALTLSSSGIDIQAYDGSYFSIPRTLGMTVSIAFMLAGVLKLPALQVATRVVKYFALAAMVLALTGFSLTAYLSINTVESYTINSVIRTVYILLAVILPVLIILLNMIYAKAVAATAGKALINRMKRNSLLFTIAVLLLYILAMGEWLINMSSVILYYTWFVLSLLMALSWIRIYRRHY